MLRMSGTTIQERPLLQNNDSQKEDRWYVTAFNNDVNTYLEVIVILMLATDCTEQEAYDATWEIDHYGKAVVFVNGEQQCRHVAKIISSIGIRVEVSPEP